MSSNSNVNSPSLSTGKKEINTEATTCSIDSVAQVFDRRILPYREVLNILLNEIKAIDFYQKSGLAPGETLTTKHYIIIAIEQILEIAKQRHWNLCIIDGQLHIYNGAFWCSLTKAELLDFLGKAAERLGVEKYNARYHAFRKDLLQQFMSSANLPKPVKITEETLVNFNNGTLHLGPEGNQLKVFAMEDMLFYQLPFNYDPKANAPNFQIFLDRVLPDKEQQAILFEYLAYLFIQPSTLKLEKALILHGSGANGKSTLFDIVNALLGKANVTNFSLQSLTNESGYHRIKLIGKLLNYASEISSKMDSTLFKQLVSGEPTEARAPYGEPILIENYAKLIFNCNELPKDVEQNHAFFRRFIILEFGVTIPMEDRNPELAQKIIASELPGVFNLVMEGMTRLLEQKKFTYSAKTEAAVNTYQMQSDSVQLFLMDDQYQKDLTIYLKLKDLYANYRQYCHDSGYKACSLRVFSDRLRIQDYKMERRSYGIIVYATKKLIS
jgi:putative DNA primase/helicase